MDSTAPPAVDGQGQAHDPRSNGLTRQPTESLDAHATPRSQSLTPQDRTDGPVRSMTDPLQNELQVQPPKPKRSGKVCGKCGEPLTGQFVRALGGTYHLECFTCHVRAPPPLHHVHSRASLTIARTAARSWLPSSSPSPKSPQASIHCVRPTTSAALTCCVTHAGRPSAAPTSLRWNASTTLSTSPAPYVPPCSARLTATTSTRAVYTATTTTRPSSPNAAMAVRHPS